MFDGTTIGFEPVAFGVSALVGYLLGSIPWGLVLVRLFGLGDIRDIGSGNIGATNVLRTGRKDLALATFLLDAGKAGAAFFIAYVVFDNYSAGLLAGAFAFLGHCYPVWLGFKGGKGAATYAGLIFAALGWKVSLFAIVSWIGTAVLTRYSSLAALVTATLLPVFAYFIGLSLFTVGILIGLTALIYIRHVENIQRLLAGTESKIGQKSKAAAAPDASVTE